MPILLNRYLEKSLEKLVEKGHSCLLLGPRQTGKTTIVEKKLKSVKNKKEYYLQDPSVRIALERDPGKIIRDVEAIHGTPYVFIDEAQKVPALFDSAQYLIDKKKARFILSGSSARKLRRSEVNLLPGRIRRFFLDPLLWGELGFLEKSALKELEIKNINDKSDYRLEDALVFGSLPGIVSLPAEDRIGFLENYGQIYLEEEIRAEALSRKIGAFSRFLELAATESGTSPNLSKLSNESGVSIPTIKEYYSLLVDTLIIERVDPYLKNSRKRLMSTPRYYFFDLGVRNAIARMPLDLKLVNAQKGILFEHFVVLEIIRRVRALGKNYKVNFWRTQAGAEVDCVIDMGDRVIPIEIKSSSHVSEGDVGGLKIFLETYSKVAEHGYVITMGENNQKITDRITAVPWFNL